MKNYNYIFPATLLCDFYKVSHREQYPKGTQQIYSTWTPRASRIQGIDKVVMFNLQAFVKKFLIEYFDVNFFSRPKEDVVNEYVRVIKYTLGVENPDASHIAALHDLGYLPVKISAVFEGTLVPIRVPMITVENTLPEHPEFFWVTNYLETLMSSELWQPMTSATIAFQYRKMLTTYAMETVGNADFVPFQGHDFSYRGMAGQDSAYSSGAGHLLSFVGTDTIPAILYHEKYYNANIEKELVGTSIPATEHSIACSYGSDNEFEYFRRLITEVYPKGFVSIVSDTYDFWKVVGEFLPALKDIILARDGKVVIRPDSGDPVKIIVGDPNASDELVRKGLIECLWDIFGGSITEKGYKLLDSHIGAIYGDSITLARAEAIVEGLKQKGFASINIVFGVGSYTYQYQTRDTFGFAMKATFAEVNGEDRLLFKDPKTDDGTKKSQRGKVVVVGEDGELKLIDGLTADEHKEYADTDLLKPVFVDGKLVREQSLADIRARLLSNL
jgi:nicotinamide phosphoribosyltransferase